jgi:hypothetical protein
VLPKDIVLFMDKSAKGNVIVLTWDLQRRLNLNMRDQTAFGCTWEFRRVIAVDGHAVGWHDFDDDLIEGSMI